MGFSCFRMAIHESYISCCLSLLTVWSGTVEIFSLGLGIIDASIQMMLCGGCDIFRLQPDFSTALQDHGSHNQFFHVGSCLLLLGFLRPPMLWCFFRLLRHPRIYGADIARALGVRISDGSSPHTRGRVTFQADRGEFPGFIPVRTGQTNCYLMHPVIP